jgi:hypothetical protein
VLLVLAASALWYDRALAHAADTKTPGGSIPAASIERLKNLGYGAYERPPAKADVSLTLRALTEPDLEISSHGSLAIEKLAADRVLDAQAVKLVLDAIIPKLRSSHGNSSEWSVRAVCALAQDTPFVAGKALSRVHAESLKMLDDRDADMRRRGFHLASHLLRLLDARQHEQTVRAMLATFRRMVLSQNPEAVRNDVIAREAGVIALSVATERIEDETLAGQVAAQLLRAIETERTPTWYRGHCELYGIAKLAHRAAEPWRSRILQTVIAAARDERYVFSLTSGEASPPHHAGAEALAVIAPLLDGRLLDKAIRAIPPITSDSPASMTEYASLYGTALKALSEQRKKIDGRRAVKQKQ